MSCDYLLQRHHARDSRSQLLISRKLNDVFELGPRDAADTEQLSALEEDARGIDGYILTEQLSDHRVAAVKSQAVKRAAENAASDVVNDDVNAVAVRQCANS